MKLININKIKRINRSNANEYKANNPEPLITDQVTLPTSTLLPIPESPTTLGAHPP